MSKSRLLVSGGGGVLGRSILEHFVKKGWITYATDVSSFDTPKKTHKLILSPTDNTKHQYKQTKEWLNTTIKDKKFDCIINVSGGFIMDKINDNNLFDNLDDMYSKIVSSSFQTAKLATDFLQTESKSLLILTGNNMYEFY